MNHLVTVVMATYRRKSSLINAIDSLLNQTYKNIELVLVDDNNDMEWNNEVQNIVNKFSTKISINYIMNNENIGSANSRNKGIYSAKGNYITFLDDDDLYLSRKIESQLKCMIINDADYSITDLYLYNDKNVLVDKRIRSYIKSYAVDDLLRYHLLYHMTGTDTFMFKTDYLISIGGFTSIDIGDEFYLMEKAIISGGKLAYFNGCFIKAYIHTGEDDGLSSGVKKIRGEKALIQEKKKYFTYLSQKDINYIYMRHYMVIAFTEIRRKKFLSFFKFAIKSFIIAPVSCVNLIMKHIGNPKNLDSIEM